MQRRIYRFLFFTGLGLATTLAVAWLMALLVEVQQGRQTSADSFDGDLFWSVTLWDRAGAAQVVSTRMRGVNVGWSAQQAAGKPNCPQMGDNQNAWASLSTGNPEWLILHYSKAVIPRRVDVYENYTAGALSKVSIFDEQGKEIVAWTGVDPTPATYTSGATAVSKIPISLNIPTNRVKIYIASDKVKGWNEIDAVGLVDDKDVQWAAHVTASSTYASSHFGGSDAAANSQMKPDDLLPSWSGFSKRNAALDEGSTNREVHRDDARGWPMLALRSETVSTDSVISQPASNLLELESLEDYPMESGRPAKSVGGWTPASSGAVAITTPSGGPVIPVPLRPIWSGLIGDTAFFGLIWFGFWAALAVPRRFVREVARFRRGACMQCGYDLGYEFINGCPECGWRRERKAAMLQGNSVAMRESTPLD